MSFLYNLCSSSSGNATFIGSQAEGFFIDMGTGVRAVFRFLKDARIDKKAIQGILLPMSTATMSRGFPLC